MKSSCPSARGALRFFVLLALVIGGEFGGPALRAQFAWQSVAASPQGLAAVAYDGGVWAAVGSRGTIVRSTDSLSFSVVYSDTSAGNFSDVAAGGGKWVAVSTSGRVAVSSNAQDWTLLPPVSGFPTTAPGLYGVTYGNGYFVAVGYRLLARSSDGVSWQIESLPAAGASFEAVAWSAAGGFVAVGQNGSMARSLDGATWTAVTSGTANSLYAVTYGAGYYVAVGYGGTIVRSADGVNWTTIVAGTPAGTGTSVAWYGIAYTGGRFVATGLNKAVIHSTDGGLTWQTAALLPIVTPPALSTPDPLAIASSATRLVIVVGDGNALTSPNPDGPQAPAISAQPADAAVRPGGSLLLSVTAVGSGLTYQWQKDGSAIAGATDATLSLTGVTRADAGAYRVIVSNSGGAVVSHAATVAVREPGRLANLSIRSSAGAQDATLIIGFSITGGDNRTESLLLRGVGPTLTGYGLAGALTDPVLSVYRGQSSVAGNDNWAGDASVTSVGDAVGAFRLGAADSKDAALLYSAAPGSYTMSITGKSAAAGIALGEIYESPSAISASGDDAPRLVNLSARTFAGNAEQTLIAGFSIAGEADKRLLVRAVGPTLAAYGVGGVVADPELKVIREGVLVASNDNWAPSAAMTQAENASGAFPLTAASGRDAALIVTLSPGVYSVQATGVNGTTGIVLLEVYELP
jgi:hypothetical protein